jgi:hypothetical protein
MFDFSHLNGFAVRICAFMLCAVILSPSPGHTQDSVDVQFPKGSYGTEISGTITGHEYIDYVVYARKGQNMTVSLRVDGTNGHGSAYFNILPAGKDYDGLFTGHMEAEKTASVTLPSDGGWAVRVYLMGNDRDADKTVGYLIDVAVR